MCTRGMKVLGVKRVCADCETRHKSQNDAVHGLQAGLDRIQTGAKSIFKRTLTFKKVSMNALQTCPTILGMNF